MANITIDTNKLSNMISSLISDSSSLKTDTSYYQDVNDIKLDQAYVDSFHHRQDLLKDANESIFFLRELEYIKQEIIKTKFRPLKAKLLFNLKTDCPSYKSHITYRTMTGVGLARVAVDYANDPPNVSVYRQEFTVAVKPLWSSYSYTKDEIEMAMSEGLRLNQDLAIECRAAVESYSEQIAWDGESDFNIQGFIDYPGLTTYVVPNGVAGFPAWTTKTNEEILEDLNGIASIVVVTTNEVEHPDHMVLPIAEYELIANRKLSEHSDKSILQYFIENNRYIKVVDCINRLAGAGAGGTDRFMVYKKEEVELNLPMLYTEEPPQQKNLVFHVIGREKTAGITIKRPLSCAFGDGI